MKIAALLKHLPLCRNGTLQTWKPPPSPPAVDSSGDDQIMRSPGCPSRWWSEWCRGQPRWHAGSTGGSSASPPGWWWWCFLMAFLMAPNSVHYLCETWEHAEVPTSHFLVESCKTSILFTNSKPFELKKKHNLRLVLHFNCKTTFWGNKKIIP